MSVDHVGKHDGTISREMRTCQRLLLLKKPQDDHKYLLFRMIFVRLDYESVTSR
jgi:hypothetical protein